MWISAVGDGLKAIAGAEEEVKAGKGGKDEAEKVVEANREPVGKWLDKKVSTRGRLPNCDAVLTSVVVWCSWATL